MKIRDSLEVISNKSTTRFQDRVQPDKTLNTTYSTQIAKKHSSQSFLHLSVLLVVRSLSRRGVGRDARVGAGGLNLLVISFRSSWLILVKLFLTLWRFSRSQEKCEEKQLSDLAKGGSPIFIKIQIGKI